MSFLTEAQLTERTERLDAIQERLDAYVADTDGVTLRALQRHAPDDLAWLLAEVARLSAHEPRYLVRSPWQGEWEVWRVWDDERIHTFRTRREAHAFIEERTGAPVEG